MRIPVLFLTIFLWSLQSNAQTIPWDNYYPEPFKPAAGGWTALPKSDDGYVLVNLPFSYQFYGNIFTSVYINNNGVYHLATGSRPM